MSKSLIRFNDSQLSTIRRTVAKDCTSEEFNLFIEACNTYNLNPFRREVYALIFSKNDNSKRQMAIIVGIDGLRSIAESYKNYRADDNEPIYIYDEKLQSDTNPLGIFSCSVKTYKSDNWGNWFAINGTVYWDEFAPLEDVWEDKKRTNKKKLKETWKSKPRLMIAKCAEAQALRKGWPAGGLYCFEEIESSTLKDVTPEQAVDSYNLDKNLRRTHAIGTIPIQWKAGEGIIAEPAGEAADKIIKFIRLSKNDAQLNAFWSINNISMKQLWAYDKNASIEVKKEYEKRLKELENG